MNILGIETSCDETAAAVVADGRRIRSNVVASQIALHRAHGGVVPELAARGHVTAILPTIEAAMAGAGVTRASVDAVAVTVGPGLAGALLVGLNVAKALAYAWRLPLVPVNHLEAHLYANWLVAPEPGMPPTPAPELPAICLLVSGGHTELILIEDHGRYRTLGRTLDDAAGEAFDKGARLLGLGYPGGPAIQGAAATGDPGRFALPRAWLGESDDFSFSGLKTALLRLVAPYRLPDAPRAADDGPFPTHRPPVLRPETPVADLAAGFQAAIVEVLATKLARAAVREGAKTVLLAGGVAANRALRERVVSAVGTEAGDLPVRVPDLSLCTDNAAMIAGAAFYALRRGEQVGWEAEISARLPLTETVGGRF
ncbi:MAG: N(6)-L-threonylcarbamoyladenine synthase [uncultured Thermomicrobiales bacterium]|uniref:tRNA N6-adenosine threonylcarbamoyltransferase n=1 Tax=uncultured Thermomicrobiales bacterium TaxID=1645740 RepID=A0A6J4UH56_9BACT|nr:MAG: N(6)-L-threonylcarbamoyladenine synthase [uncultured Thermomicrobiales bacterium]